MKILVVSDLHWELHRKQGDIDRDLDNLVRWAHGVEVVVIAGDLTSADRFARDLPALARIERPVVYVLGNHESWGGFVETANFRAKDLAPPNVHVLEMDTAEILGQRFLGGTMWFDGSPSMFIDGRKICDSVTIPARNRQFHTFLRRNLRPGDIVVTHHLPSYKCVAPAWVGDGGNVFFVSKCDGLIRDREPKLWVHGHTHEDVDLQLGPTRVVANPADYPGRRASLYSPKIIEV